MTEWLKQQYNDLLFKIFLLMPSYIAKECYKEFDEKYKELQRMTEKQFNVFDVDGTIFLEDHKKGSYHIGEIGN